MRSLSTLLRSAFIGMLSLASGLAGAQDGYITNFDIPRYIEAGIGHSFTLRARNASGASIEFFQISWRVDGGTVHTMNQPVGGGGIVGNNSSYLEVTHPEQMNVAQGQHTLEIWITVPGETNVSNDTLTFTFIALNNWAEKVVLIEARTETWCPQCPPANTITDQLMQDPSAAVVKFHLSDGLEFPDGQLYYGQFDTTYTPQAVLEFGEYGEYGINASSNLWPQEIAARAQGVSPVSLSMEATVNNSTRQLTATIEATFTYALTGPFKFNVHLAENNVPGPQANAPPNYIHHGVMRAILGGPNGTSGIIPNNPVIGTTYSHTYSYTIPAEFDISQLYLVGMIEHVPAAGERYALNAVSSQHAAVAIDEMPNSDLLVFPNPFTEDLTIRHPKLSGNARVELIGLDGRIVMDRNVIFRENTNVDLGIDKQIAEGTYFLRISSGSAVLMQQIVKSSR